MSIILGIYKQIERLEKKGVNIGAFCVKHLNIKDLKSYREFITGYETWRLQNSKNKDQMRQWEKENNRGVYHQSSL